jgi:glutamate N-acetyltransferase/amino-acid N-acetyltransferase
MTPGPGISRTLLPLGFTSSGINCGVRKYRPDLGILISDREATAAGVYTINQCKAAPILYSKALTPSTKIRAIVTNSGQANAATGAPGVEANLKMASAAALALGCQATQILTASTGVIGQHLEIDKIVYGMPELVSRAVDTAEAFALAILTTDLVPKSVTTEVPLSGGTVRITGICKGSGMIHPNMATMLGYLLTDAVMSPAVAQKLLSQATDLSFNMISVDGDTSTNDAVFLLANGAAGVAVEKEEDVQAFRSALVAVAQVLAKSIARDGEGSTKLIEVALDGAPDEKLAKQAARGITVSPLIKAAIHGEDPNWGRILARLGAEGVPAACLDKMCLKIQDHVVMRDGLPIVIDRDAVKLSLKKDTIRIAIDFGSGTASAVAWGCDLSKKYVDINAEYST